MHQFKSNSLVPSNLIKNSINLNLLNVNSLYSNSKNNSGVTNSNSKSGYSIKDNYIKIDDNISISAEDDIVPFPNAKIGIVLDSSEDKHDSIQEGLIHHRIDNIQFNIEEMEAHLKEFGRNIEKIKELIK